MSTTIIAGNATNNGASISSDTAGTLQIQTGSTPTTAITVDASQNVGVGITPSAWSVLKGLQVGNASLSCYSGDTSALYLSANAYYNGSNFTYINSNYSNQYRQQAGQHQWYNAASGTAGAAISYTQAMTLDASGNLLVAKAVSSATTVGCQFLANGEIYSASSASTSASNSYLLYSTGASAFRFYVGLNGQINATSTSITAISDISLKENVRDLETGLSEIMALKPRRFDWKEETQIEEKNVAGFIAQELEEVLPELVYEYKYNDTETKKSIKMGDILPTLVKAIQEQQTMIEELKTKVAALEAK